MNPTLLNLPDLHDLIESEKGLLLGTFLTPMMLMCISITVVSEFRHSNDEDTASALWRELRKYIPISFTDDSLNPILEFVHGELIEMTTRYVYPVLDDLEVDQIKLYAYPVFRDTVVVTDEERPDVITRNSFIAPFRKHN